MKNEETAKLCTGECPFGYDCKAMDCEECAKIHADKEA
jgi:hypothetical protein